MQSKKQDEEIRNLKSEMAQNDKSSRKLLQGAKQEKFKQDTKMQQMKHELKRLELDNHKLRQTLQ